MRRSKSLIEDDRIIIRDAGLLDDGEIDEDGDLDVDEWDDEDPEFEEIEGINEEE